MVLYTSNFSATYNPELMINNYISYSNNVFQNSNMATRLTLKHHQVFELPNNSEVSGNLKDALASSKEVINLRNIYRPDIVVYLTRASSKLCGIANFPPHTRDARSAEDSYSTTREMAVAGGVSVVGWNCPTYVFTHEIGHNFGGGHGPVDISVSYLDGLISDNVDDHPGQPLTWSRGHGVRDIFRTVMTYAEKFGSAPVVALHSNPSVLQNGLPSGTSSRNNAAGMDTIVSRHVSHYSSCFPGTWKQAFARGPYDVFACGGTCTTYEMRRSSDPRQGLVKTCTSYAD